MPVPIEANLSLYRGADSEFTFTLDPVVDITGWTLVFTIARDKNTTTKLFSVVCTHVDEPGGVYKAVMPAADAAVLQTGNFWYDVWRTDAGFESIQNLGRIRNLGNVRIPVATP